MSSRASTPPRDDDDDLHDMLNAMTQSSPVVPDARGASKRSHAAMVGDDETTSDNEQRAGNAPPFALANRNIVSAARHYGERKRLEGEQLTELDVFLGVSCLRPFPSYILLTSLKGSSVAPGGKTSRKPLCCRESSQETCHYQTCI